MSSTRKANRGDKVEIDYYAHCNKGLKGTCTGKIGQLLLVKWEDGSTSKIIDTFVSIVND